MRQQQNKTNCCFMWAGSFYGNYICRSHMQQLAQCLCRVGDLGPCRSRSDEVSTAKHAQRDPAVCTTMALSALVTAFGPLFWVLSESRYACFLISAGRSNLHSKGRHTALIPRQSKYRYIRYNIPHVTTWTL